MTEKKISYDELLQMALNLKKELDLLKEYIDLSKDKDANEPFTFCFHPKCYDEGRCGCDGCDGQWCEQHLEFFEEEDNNYCYKCSLKHIQKIAKQKNLLNKLKNGS